MRLGILALVIFFSLGTAFAANISGSIYSWENLEQVKSAIVEVNSTPLQRTVSIDGTYSFELPAGVYRMAGKVVVNGEITLSDDVLIQVGEGDKSYKLDLILFPHESSSPENGAIFDESALGPDSDFLADAKIFPYFQLSAIGFALFLTAGALFLFFRGKKRVKGKAAREKPEKNLPRFGKLGPDAKMVIEKLSEAGGRMSQRDLRRSLPYSEAKASLVISELEARGFIGKYKRGRGNLLVLKLKSP